MDEYDSKDPLQNSDQFWNSFNNINQDIDDLLNVTNGIGEPQLNLEEHFEKFNWLADKLSALHAESTIYLSSWDQRKSLEAISEIKAKITEKKLQLQPKKKFSFKNRKNITKIEISEDNNSKNKTSESTNSQIDTENSFYNLNDTSILISSNNTDEKYQEIQLSNLKNCKIYIERNIQALRIYNLNNCSIFCSLIGGSCLIQDSLNSNFYFCSQQIRIHDCKECNFFISTKSNPIIEKSSGLNFGCYNISFPSKETQLKDWDLNNQTWKNVEDFNWFRKQHSPNWKLITEDDPLIVDIDISQETLEKIETKI